MTEQAIGPLRRRMIEDMTIRRFDLLEPRSQRHKGGRETLWSPGAALRCGQDQEECADLKIRD
jgi:hypothetical protein